MSSGRTTLNLEPRAAQIARRRARSRSISLGKAVSELIVEAETHAPKTEMKRRKNGMPVFVPPPGTPPIDPALIRKAIEEDW